MDTLRGITEYEEAAFGESILARDEALALLAQVPGLGPPDLVWLRKAPAGTQAQVKAHGYYHYALGRDVSSSASVAAYFAQISSLVEPPTFFQGLWLSEERKVDCGFYCCYEPLSRLDVRCELRVPGGVKAAALDAQGNLHEVTEELWSRCQLAAFVRAELLDAELVVHAASNNLQRSDPVPDPAAEASLLDVVNSLYQKGLLPGGLDALAHDQSGGSTAEHMDIVLFSLLHHFGRRQRWAAAAGFFARLAEHYGAASVYVAAALREAGNGADALEVLQRAAEQEPFHAQVLTALGTEYLYDGQVEAALKLARRAIRTAPALRPSWLLLARCYARRGELALSLLSLNATPAPPLPIQEEELLFAVPPPKPKACTKPQWPPYDCDTAAAAQLLHEEAGTLSDVVAHASSGAGTEHPLFYLPGAVLVNREPPDRAAWADVAPYRATRAALAAVYSVLQELVVSAGWDNFLDVRSEVFIMYTEAAESDADKCNSAHSGGDDQNWERHDKETADQAYQDSPSQGWGGGRDSGRNSTSHSGVDEDTGRSHPSGPPALVQQRGVGSLLAEAAAAAATTAATATMHGMSLADQSSNGTVLAAPAPVAPAAAGAQPLAAQGPMARGSGGPTPGPVHLPGMARRLPAASQASVPHFLSTPDLPKPALGSPAVSSSGAQPSLLVPPSPPSLPPQAQSAAPSPSAQAPAGGAQCARQPMTGLQAPSAGVLGVPGTAITPVGVGPVVTSTHHPAMPPTQATAAALVPNPSASPAVATSPSVPAPPAPKPVPAKPATGLWSYMFGGGTAGPVTEGLATTAPARLAPLAPAPELSLWTPAADDSATCSSAAGMATTGTWTHSPDGVHVPGPVTEGTGAPADWLFAHRAGNLQVDVVSCQAKGGHGSPAVDKHAHGQHSPADARSEPRLQRQPRRSDAARRAEEWDREAAVVGQMPPPAVAGEPPPKRVCARWLDELIVAFWHDLQAYLEWQASDRDLVSMVGQTHAGLILDLPALSASAQHSQRSSNSSEAADEGGGGSGDHGGVASEEQRAAALARAPNLSCGDWVRRGLLAERLYHDAPALLAYRAALQLGFSLVAYHALMRLAAASGLTKQTLLAVHQVMAWHDDQHGKLIGNPGGGSSATSRPWAFRQLPLFHHTTEVEGRSVGTSSRIGDVPVKLPSQKTASKAGDALPSVLEGAFACPLSVLCCVSTLVALVGLEEVVEGQVGLGFAMHPAVRQLLESYADWHDDLHLKD